MKTLLEADVPAAPLVLPSDLANAAQFQVRGLIEPTDAGPLVRFPVRMTGMGPTPRSAPSLGSSQESPA